jgi:hypothetical protein
VVDFGSVRCPLTISKGILDGTSTTIKSHFGVFSAAHPYLLPHYIYLRIGLLWSVGVPQHVKHIKPFGTLATIKSHLAPGLLVKTKFRTKLCGRDNIIGYIWISIHHKKVNDPSKYLY